jgi:hypothetical protein
MSQGNSGGQWINIAGTAAGTTVALQNPAVLTRLVVPAYFEGTVTLFDSATLTGTAAGNQILAVKGTADVPYNVELGIQLKNGLTYLLGGTTTLTAVVN